MHRSSPTQQHYSTVDFDEERITKSSVRRTGVFNAPFPSQISSKSFEETDEIGDLVKLREEKPKHRRRISLPETGLGAGSQGSGSRRGSLAGGRRGSLTFQEWNQQVEERHKLEQIKKDAEKRKRLEQGAGARRSSLTYEQWTQHAGERLRCELAKKEEERKREEEKKKKLAEEKVKRKISFDQWVDSKQQRNLAAQSADSRSDREGRAERSEDAFEKWLMKKEVEKLELEERRLTEAREQTRKLLQMPTNKVSGRRRASVMF